MKAALVLFLVSVCMLGCSSGLVSAIKAGGTALSQRGPAATPAKAETVTTRASLPLPAGTRIELASRPAENGAHRAERDLGAPEMARAAASLSVTLPEPAVLSVETVHERATAPQSFAPAEPASPAEKADGWAVLAYRIVLPLGAVLFLVGLVKDFPAVMIGGGAAASAAAVGLFVVKNPWVEWVMGGGVCVAIAGFCIWHFMVKPRQAAVAT